MRRIPLLPAALALAGLAGCMYDYGPPPAYRETTYSYAAPAYYYPPPPSAGTTVVVYHEDYGRYDYGWHNYARDKGWY